MNYRSSISFHGKRLSWCPRTWHRCRNQPCPRGGFGPGCLNVPETFAHRCTRKSLLQPQLPVARPGPSSATLLPTPASHGVLVAGLSCTPFPSSPLKQQGAFYFLLLTSVRNDVEPVCMKGRIKDNIRAVHSVLTVEIPAHGDTSLLTPPICIFSPLGNSGGQIKQVCSGLGQIKEPQTTISVYLSGSGIIH